MSCIFCTFAETGLGLNPPATHSGHLCITLNLSLMAIINSLAIGKSVKSAGNLTYKTVRGRTIASQRITSNKSNTLLQSSQRAHFSMCAKAATLIQTFINSCYERSKYGSARNQFMSVNKSYDGFGVVSEVQEGAIPIADIFVPAFVDAVDDLQTTRIKYSAYGSSSVITREETNGKLWSDSAENSFTICEVSKVEFVLPVAMAPEKVEVVVCGLFGDSTSGLAHAQITSQTISLNSTDIAALKEKGITLTPVTDSQGNVISFTVEKSEPTLQGEYEAFAVVFPRINSKIPKLRGLIHVQVTPLP